jgi:dihydropteroate synthase
MNRLKHQPITDPFLPRQWRLAHGRLLEIGPAGLIVGIVNVTPDSFSDGGQHFDEIMAVNHARRLVEEGAIMIDIGGESTRPGAEPISGETERKRILPVIQALASPGGPLISVDTWRASTARAAIEAGAHAVNDIWGLQKDPALGEVVSKTGAGVVIMHNGRDRVRDRDVIKDQMYFLRKSLQVAERKRITEDRIVLDPGFGFAKDPDENFELLGKLEKLHELGYPIMAGTSRKRFIGAATGRDAEDRDIGTAATSVIARLKGAALFRVHDVAANRDALAIADAVMHAGEPAAGGTRN